MKHYIIVKLNNRNDYEKIIDGIKETINQCLKLDGITNVNYFKNVIDRDNRYDLMIEMTMEKESLEIYDNSIYHKEFKEKYHQYFEKKTIIDID